MDEPVLRAHADVDPRFPTDVLGRPGWIGDATVVEAPATRIGDGLMGVCARFSLRLDRDVPNAPRRVVGKFAAPDPTAREFMARSGYRNEVCFDRHFATRVSIRAPRCAHVAIDDEGWFTLIHARLPRPVPHGDWQGFSRGNGMSDVSFLIGNALTPEVRRANEERLVRDYHAALVAAGVASYPFAECWDDYARSLLSALLTTIFGAMYGVRTERGDRMFELMGAGHARQILDLGAGRFLDD